MPQTTSKELIMCIRGKDVVLTDLNGVCMASSNSKNIGEKMCLPTDKARSKANFYPLNSEKDTKVTLMVNKSDVNKTNLELVKNLAKLTLQQYLKIVEAPSSSIDQFVSNIIINRDLSQSKMSSFESEAKSLGLNLDIERATVIIKIDGFTEKFLLSSSQDSDRKEEIISNWKEKIKSAFAGFFGSKESLIISYIGDDRFIVLVGVDQLEHINFRNLMISSFESIFGPVRGLDKIDLSVGFGDQHDGLKGLSDGYKEAHLALTLGERLVNDKNRCHYFGDLGILRALAVDSKEQKLNFAREVLESLDNEELCKTLDVYFEKNLNVKDTAIEMNLHPNTVLYRLKRIEEIMGLDPRVFHQAYVIKTAILINKLFS